RCGAVAQVRHKVVGPRPRARRQDGLGAGHPLAPRPRRQPQPQAQDEQSRSRAPAKHDCSSSLESGLPHTDRIPNSTTLRKGLRAPPLTAGGTVPYSGKERGGRRSGRGTQEADVVKRGRDRGRLWVGLFLVPLSALRTAGMLYWQFGREPGYTPLKYGELVQVLSAGRQGGPVSLARVHVTHSEVRGEVAATDLVSDGQDNLPHTQT